ncbi:hypothetical protein E2C01_040910 [Portunus trituberculatus]|uniref:Uncharacterized protein n=1 Tax=Portunus trituberculatus TaxID=210409 RepID=A0A5B7FQ17_PORTR|nr:hypothetical protein [Portunus trituberculatus]
MLTSVAKTRKSLTLQVKLDILHRHERSEKTNNSIARHHLGSIYCLNYFQVSETTDSPFTFSVLNKIAIKDRKRCNISAVRKRQKTVSQRRGVDEMKSFLIPSHLVKLCDWNPIKHVKRGR